MEHLYNHDSNTFVTNKNNNDDMRIVAALMEMKVVIGQVIGSDIVKVIFTNTTYMVFVCYIYFIYISYFVSTYCICFVIID